MNSPVRLFLGLTLGAFSPLAIAQTPTELLQTLSAANDHAVDAWRSQNRAAFADTFAPGALYVSSDGIFAVHDILDGLMTCTVGPVSGSKQQVKSVTDTTAVLVLRQHQQVTCSGHQEPSEINSTQTFVKLNGKWKVALRTDTPAH